MEVMDLTSLWIAIAWGLGLLFYYLEPTEKILLFLLIVSALIWIVKLNKRKMVFLILVLLLGICWAIFDDSRGSSQLNQVVDIEKMENLSLIATGRIDSFPVVDGDRLRFFFKMQNFEQDHKAVNIKERLWVSIRLLSQNEQSIAKTLVRGDQITLQLLVTTPSPPTNPGAFNFPNYLWGQYSYYQANGEGLDTITVVKPSSLWGWKGITEIRKSLERRLDQIQSKDIAGLMKGMLLGNQQEVSTELEEIYRDTGIIHILAISGTHVMLVIGALILLLQLLRLTRERTYEILFCFLPFYMIITGLSPSVVRASLMGMIYLLARRLYQRYSALKAISLVFMILTFFTPRIIFAVGFQLSFAVSLGLILFTQPLANKLKEQMHWLPKPICSALALTFIAQVFAFPILATTFNQIPLLSLPINLILMPFYALIIPWGYFALMIALIWQRAGEFIAVPLDGALNVIHFILSKVNAHPQFIYSVGSLPLWWWIIYCLLCLLIFTPMLHSARQLKNGLLIVCCLLLLMPYIYNQSSIKVTFLDVGQGDSILIQGPRHHSILIDGGGVGFTFKKEDWQIRKDPYEVGKDVVLPALRSLGVTQLDWLVLTHGDGDHIGGLQEVVRQVPIKNVLVNGMVASTKLEQDLLQTIIDKKIPIYQAAVGPWLMWDGQIKLDILNPSEYALMGMNDNDASIVLMLSAYGRKLLFTGDLEATGEERLIDQFEDLQTDILKVGHHGSKSSTTGPFLKHITPKIAVISVGKDNRYGHPNSDVMQRIKENQVDIYRTDLLGALTFTIKKNGQINYKQWK